MKKNTFAAVLSAAVLMLSSVAAFAADPRHEPIVGAVYAMTNDDSDNEVVIFNRDESGMLTMAETISTGGTGSGSSLDPLGSQHSLILSHDKMWLLAVNAGSSEISVFRVIPDGLKLVDKVSSGGLLPISLTIDQDLVYVLNAGSSPNITGFTLGRKGSLTPLPQSARSLGTGGFAQVGFDPQGDHLVVTDKANNRILVFAVDKQGLPGTNPVVSPSNGITPFGFIFDQRGHLLVVEAGSDAVSSYKILKDDTLQVISASVPNGQKAACWIAGNRRGDIFTANPGTNSISSYRLRAGKGSLALFNGTAGLGNTPLDLSTTVNGRFLYALDPTGGAIDMFEIEQDGSLTALGAVSGGFSLAAQGIAAR